MRGIIQVTPDEKDRCLEMIRATFITATCCNTLSMEDIEWLVNEVWLNAVSKIIIDYQPNNQKDRKV